MTTVRFIYNLMADGKTHEFTSPDVKGFRATGPTREKAYNEALAVLEIVNEIRGVPKDEVIKIDVAA